MENTESGLRSYRLVSGRSNDRHFKFSMQSCLAGNLDDFSAATSFSGDSRFDKIYLFRRLTLSSALTLKKQFILVYTSE